jgi:hypothetical protein
MHPRDQTIFALSSGRPPTAIAMVRVSGAQARSVLSSLAGKTPMPRMATRALLRYVASQPIDDAVVLWFPGPASATGEDVAEFHIHGGRAVLAALYAALSAFENVRVAEPGEFTRRAFENGKLDLTEAEGLDDLIHADTDRQRRQALRQLKGLRGEQGGQHRASAMDVKFRDVLSRRAGRTRKPQHHRIVDRPLADIPEQRAGGRSRRRQFAGQRRHDLFGLRTRDTHQGNRTRQPARRQCKDGLIPRMHGLFVREVLKRQRDSISG